MRVWQPMLVGLYRLLARHGAFRDVRWWRLSTDRNGRPGARQARGGQSTSRPPGTAPPRRPPLGHRRERLRLAVLVRPPYSRSLVTLVGPAPTLGAVAPAASPLLVAGRFGPRQLHPVPCLGARASRMRGSFRTKLDCRPMFFTCRCSRWNRNRWRSGRACWPARVKLDALGGFSDNTVMT